MKNTKFIIAGIVIILMEAVSLIYIGLYDKTNKAQPVSVTTSDISITDGMIVSEDKKTGYLHGLWGNGYSNYSYGLCCGVNLQTMEGSETIEKIIFGKFAEITQWEQQIEGEGFEEEKDNYFWRFPNLKEIQVEEGNEQLMVRDGILYHRSKATGKPSEMEACVPSLKGRIVIPDGVELVNGMNNCREITSVTIPASVVSILPGALGNLKNCTEFLVDENNEKYTSIDGVIYTKNQKKLIAYPAGKDATDFQVQKGVKVEDGAFQGVKKR